MTTVMTTVTILHKKTTILGKHRSELCTAKQNPVADGFDCVLQSGPQKVTMDSLGFGANRFQFLLDDGST